MKKSLISLAAALGMLGCQTQPAAKTALKTPGSLGALVSGDLAGYKMALYTNGLGDGCALRLYAPKNRELHDFAFGRSWFFRDENPAHLNQRLIKKIQEDPAKRIFPSPDRTDVLILCPQAESLSLR